MTLGYAEFQDQLQKGIVVDAAARIAREARALCEAMINAAVPANPWLRVGDCLIPTDSSDDEDGTTVDLPDDEPDDFYSELRDEMRAER